MIKCKWCGSTNIIKDGTLKTKHWGIKQNYKCKKCNRNFVLDSANNKKHPYHSKFMKKFMKEHHSFKGKTYEEFYGIEKAKQIKEKMSKKKKGRKSWNKNLKGEELKKHYKNGFKGTFKKGEDNINFGRETPTIKGEKHWNWKGGITPENHGIRDSLQIRKWRKKVFERDNYICQICGKRGYCLHAHHIKSFVNFPELRFVLDNGQTLCKECHLTIHTHNN